MKDVFDIADDLGPSKIIHVYEPSVNLKAILVVYIEIVGKILPHQGAKIIDHATGQTATG